MGLRVEHEGFGPAWLSFEHCPPVATTAILSNEQGEIAFGTANVHPDDQFVKETGRRVALKKLQKQLKALGYPGTFLGAVWRAYAMRNGR